MEESKKRKTYSPEFKAEAVKLAESTSLSHASKELGVSVGSLRNWIAKSATGPTADPSKPSYADLERENRRLRREMGYLEKINTVLKKSTAIFSQDAMGDLK